MVSTTSSPDRRASASPASRSRSRSRDAARHASRASTSMKPRDHVPGVLVGNVVTAAGHHVLAGWPVLAGTEMAKSLQSALKHLAALSRRHLRRRRAGGWRDRRGFRLQIHRDPRGHAASARGGASSSPAPERPNIRSGSAGLLALAARGAAGVPARRGPGAEPSQRRHPAGCRSRRTVPRAVAVAIRPNLEAATECRRGSPGPPPDLDARIADADAALALRRQRHRGSGRDGGGGQMRSQLELYRTLARCSPGCRARARALGAGDAASRPSAAGRGV